MSYEGHATGIHWAPSKGRPAIIGRKKPSISKEEGIIIIHYPRRPVFSAILEKNYKYNAVGLMVLEFSSLIARQ